MPLKLLLPICMLLATSSQCTASSLFTLASSMTSTLASSKKVAHDFTTSAFHMKQGIASLDSRGFPSLSNWRVWETAYQALYLPRAYQAHDRRDITVLDAKARRSSLSYKEQGFDLVRLNRTIAELDYLSQEGQAAFRQEVHAIARRLHPQAKVVAIGSNIFRGGKGQEPVSKTGGVHQDLYQNLTAYKAYVGADVYEDAASVAAAKTNPVMAKFLQTVKQARASGLKLRRVVGFWKPAAMQQPVCDNPLVYMDASTFHEREQTQTRFQIPVIINGAQGTPDQRSWFKGMSGGVHHHPGQRWYYFPEQRTDELAVFTHYSADGFFVNPHGTVSKPGCPNGSEKRKSVETRVALFW